MTEQLQIGETPSTLPKGTRWVSIDRSSGEGPFRLRWLEVGGCKTFSYVQKAVSPGAWQEAYSPKVESHPPCVLEVSKDRVAPSRRELLLEGEKES